MRQGFMIAKETDQEQLDWGRQRWLCNPPTTGAEQLTVIEVMLAPGKGHNFHKHPDQERETETRERFLEHLRASAEDDPVALRQHFFRDLIHRVERVGLRFARRDVREDPDRAFTAAAAMASISLTH